MKQYHGNYHHTGELKRLGQQMGWSKHRIKSERGRLLSMERREAYEYMQELRRSALQ